MRDIIVLTKQRVWKFVHCGVLETCANSDFLNDETGGYTADTTEMSIQQFAKPEKAKVRAEKTGIQEGASFTGLQ